MDKDKAYVPPDTTSPRTSARVTRETPQKVTPGIVTTFKSYEDRTLTNSTSGVASSSEGCSTYGSDFVSNLE